MYRAVTCEEIKRKDHTDEVTKVKILTVNRKIIHSLVASLSEWEPQESGTFGPSRIHHSERIFGSGSTSGSKA